MCSLRGLSSNVQFKRAGYRLWLQSCLEAWHHTWCLLDSGSNKKIMLRTQSIHRHPFDLKLSESSASSLTKFSFRPIRERIFIKFCHKKLYLNIFTIAWKQAVFGCNHTGTVLGQSYILHWSIKGCISCLNIGFHSKLFHHRWIISKSLLKSI